MHDLYLHTCSYIYLHVTCCGRVWVSALYAYIYVLVWKPHLYLDNKDLSPTFRCAGFGWACICCMAVCISTRICMHAYIHPSHAFGWVSVLAVRLAVVVSIINIGPPKHICQEIIIMLYNFGNATFHETWSTTFDFAPWVTEHDHSSIYQCLLMLHTHAPLPISAEARVFFFVTAYSIA